MNPLNFVEVVQYGVNRMGQLVFVPRAVRGTLGLRRYGCFFSGSHREVSLDFFIDPCAPRSAIAFGRGSHPLEQTSKESLQPIVTIIGDMGHGFALDDLGWRLLSFFFAPHLLFNPPFGPEVGF